MSFAHVYITHLLMSIMFPTCMTFFLHLNTKDYKIKINCVCEQICATKKSTRSEIQLKFGQFSYINNKSYDLGLGICCRFYMNHFYDTFMVFLYISWSLKAPVLNVCRRSTRIFIYIQVCINSNSSYHFVCIFCNILYQL